MEPSAPPRPHLTLLGDFEMCFGAEPLRVSQPGQRVIAYLAIFHHHKPVRRATLAERLWPEAPPTRAASSLRSVLWRLPRPRGRTLVTGNATTVRLHEDVHVDLWRGEEHVRALGGEAAPLPQLLEEITVLQRDLLPDWYEDWLQVEQESYRQKRLHTLERIAGILCERGEFTDALSAALEAVRSDPLRESAHRRVIQVHLAEGNHAEALRQYDAYRRLLADELGLPPSPAIREMVSPLLGRPADGRPRRLPRQRTPSAEQHRGPVRHAHHSDAERRQHG